MKELKSYYNTQYGSQKGLYTQQGDHIMDPLIPLNVSAETNLPANMQREHRALCDWSFSLQL